MDELELQQEAVATAPPRSGRLLLWSLFLLSAALLGAIGFVAIAGMPWILIHWRHAEAQAQAEAAYLKRQAELKAETEASNDRLEVLDRRIHFISLGFREVARKVAPIVVHISNEIESDEPGKLRFIRDFETGRSYTQQSEGSGILVRPGWVLTNHHVVKKAEFIRVTFADGEEVRAKADDIFSDPLTDLAVVRLPDSKSTLSEGKIAAEFADSDKDVQVGDWALAVGSPFGLKQTVTAGIVSAKGRVELGILDQVELLQTDVAINPGNSGGPLFDQMGRVIGINVAIASKNGINQGVSFAIPSNAVRQVVEELIEHGQVVRGFLGIGLQELPGSLERKLGVLETGGVIVATVRPDTPAHAADIRTGDVILRYDGQSVGSGDSALNHLRLKIAATKPEQIVSIELLRGSERITVEATIAKRETTNR